MEAAVAAQEIDFSLAALFLRATFTVKLVMLLLICMSVWSWAIIFEKSVRLRRVRANSQMFEDAFWSGQALDDLFERIGREPRSAIERVFSAGMNEWRKSVSKRGGLIPGTRERIDRSMTVAVARETEKISARLGFLATVASTAPFIGRFGTVWGIKNAFEEIAIQQNTNLAVVAPGIAEALVATALGLLAAIPAVVAYNKLSADVNGLGGELENFADEFSTILSRQIEKDAA
jgi:biopolymer transport protein TolQ